MGDTLLILVILIPVTLAKKISHKDGSIILQEFKITTRCAWHTDESTEGVVGVGVPGLSCNWSLPPPLSVFNLSSF